MFAVDHAATALLIKRRFPSVPLTPLLLSVQAMELAWVGLNYLGIERTTTEASVRSVADIHLAYMPFSHSVATPVAGALLAWLLVEKGLGRPAFARAIAIGIVSHLVLDVFTHAQDIVLWPAPHWQLVSACTMVRRCGPSFWRWRSAWSAGASTAEAGHCSQ
jgi:hypothetical protein